MARVPELFSKFWRGVTALTCGLSLGRERPSIPLGAFVGTGMASISRYDQLEQRYLITAGASAGLAAAFNAPLAGVIFAVEELLKSFTPHMLTSVLLASIGGELGSKYVFGLKPVFGFVVQK
ncbi:MAG: chloride channel protein, partial [Spirochaetales bacterium]